MTRPANPYPGGRNQGFSPLKPGILDIHQGVLLYIEMRLIHISVGVNSGKFNNYTFRLSNHPIRGFLSLGVRES